MTLSRVRVPHSVTGVAALLGIGSEYHQEERLLPFLVL